MSENIEIVKMSGDLVPFDVSKLTNSLKRTGADDVILKQVIHDVEDILYEGITTTEIYKKAFTLLRKSSRSNAARYKLKKAILELGPTGYPFEKFVSEILSHLGYKVKVGSVVKGHCVDHEVDIEAEKDEHHFMIECKFHNDQKNHCNVKVPLYIQSRFKDVKRQWIKKKGHDQKFHQGWIYTNTRFTLDASQFGNCVNLKLVGWSYPEKDNLRDQIITNNLYPITCLTTLTKREKQELLEKDIILCKHLLKNRKALDMIGIKKSKSKAILEECKNLCYTHITK
ncbi:MAG: restriction endonuclease [Brumimicrobium sp.]